MSLKGFLKNRLHQFLLNRFQNAIHSFAKKHSPLYIIQAGANDGKSNDLIHQLNKRNSTKAILIEPVPYVFEMLAKQYEKNPNIQLLQIAVSDSDSQKSLPFYYLRPENGKDFHPIYNQWGSFSLQHLQKFAKHVPNFQELLTVDNVNTQTINQVIDESGFPHIDILATDVEGFDGKIIASIDFSKHHPKLILFEHIHIQKDEIKLLMQLLQNNNYNTYSVGFDTICIHTSLSGVDWQLSILKKLRSKWFTPSA